MADLTSAQRDAVVHSSGPLLVIAGAGTGKTTVIARRIAWMIATKRARPEDILALTFTDRAAAEMEERVDLLVPYGYLDVSIKTFHAFGDQLLRDHAVRIGLTPNFRVFSKAEQLVFLRRRLFDLPLRHFRPLSEPTRFLEALATVFSRAKDEAVTPQEFHEHAKTQGARAGKGGALSAAGGLDAERLAEVARCYDAYQGLLRQADAADFGDLVLLAAQLLEENPDVLERVRQRFRVVLVDEFQDTNYAQFRLLQLLAPGGGDVTAVADDDQSIYQWRGAALSNILKFLGHYAQVATVVLAENFRSSQAILDCAYRLIRFNDPDRLEVRNQINKRLSARGKAAHGSPPAFQVFDTISSEADWVAQTIRTAVEAGQRRPSDFAILVRSNREADAFLRALNVAGLPWRFSGASGLFAREESKLLVSCLRVLADPDDSLSWYHVASSMLYDCPMPDLSLLLAYASKTHRSFRMALDRILEEPTLAEGLSVEGRRVTEELKEDVRRLLERSRTLSCGQLLYQWLSDRGVLRRLGRGEGLEEAAQLQTIARFFDQLRRVEELVGGRLPELMQHLELFQAMGGEPVPEDDAWADRVQVLTIHKAKGLEFPVVFLVGLAQGRFPTPKRHDPIELPDALLKDILPSGDYHLQEERRLFYVGMTRAKEELYLSASYSYGGTSIRKVSQFVLEALDLSRPAPQVRMPGAQALIGRSRTRPPIPVAVRGGASSLRLDAHGADDYVACPFKYRYTRVLRLPVMRHHLVAYGTAIHQAVAAFFTRKLQHGSMDEEELLRVFERTWKSEGFLTREHEELRMAQGRETLRRFFALQQAHPEEPTLIEEKFHVRLDDFVITGRWDRVDRSGEEAVIIDYKSSDVREQAAADRRARESLQLQVYALAWQLLHGWPPSRVELRFLETGLTGAAQFDEKDMERTRTVLLRVAAGIRANRFEATPSEFACHRCAFQEICPFAFQPKKVAEPTTSPVR